MLHARTLTLLLLAITVTWSCDDHPGGIAPTTAAAVEHAQKCQETAPEPVLTQEPAAIRVTPPDQQPLTTSDGLLADPSTEHLRQIRFFAEPLVPVRAPTVDENQPLAQMLRSYQTNPTTKVLQQFLDANPQSPWAGSVALHLGNQYRKLGYFSKAETTWRFAWDLLRDDAANDDVRLAADRAVGELAQFYVWIGNLDSLKLLLAQVANRPQMGPGAERLRAARGVVGFMENHPELNYVCGPLGIETISRLNRLKTNFSALTRTCTSTSKGVNLGRVEDLAREVGLRYQAAKRIDVVPIPLPALVHWKFDHYSVISRYENGRYLISDQTFDAYQAQEQWISSAALDEGMSGACLIPATEHLPTGWALLADAEKATIWGKGAPPGFDGDGTDCGGSSEGGGSGDGGGGGGCKGMPIYGLHPANVSLDIVDMPVGYQPPRGPAVDFILRYNSKEAHLPATFQFSNVGAKWNHNWLSYVVDDPSMLANLGAGGAQWGDATRYPRGGGTERFTLFYAKNVTTGVVTADYSTPYYRNMNRLRYTGSVYEIITTDRITYTYGRSDGALSYPRKMMLTKISDRFGQSVTVTYDASNRITGLTDALGRVTTFQYTGSDPLKITKVIDPFGRSTSLSYTSGVLTGVTDMIGLSSSFAYEPSSDVINAFTTPYGTTTFTRGEVLWDGTVMRNWLEATDPGGDKERIDYATHNFSQLPSIDAPEDYPSGFITAQVNYATTFYFDKKAMRLNPGDYSKATKAIGWLRNAGSRVADMREYIKYPLQNRIWYNYPGQSTGIPGTSIDVTLNKPSKIGRVIDDGSTQASQTTYNGDGMVTETYDPLGRKMGYTYDGSGLNLTEVRMTTGGSADLLMKATYTAQNLPLKVTDANGRATDYTYNSFGQPLTVTLPLRAGQPVEKVTYTYDAQGFLTKITDPLNGTTDFTYDGYGRIRTVKDRDTYTLTYDYDNLDRLTKVTFPDGTYTQTSYGRLDAEWTRDREGRWTRMWYDYLRKVVAVRDPAGRVTGLSWCRCGALSSLTDPMGRMTVWNYDLQGRLISKAFPDSTATTYAYQPKSGRLLSQTDAKGQTTQYDYFGDDKLKQISYLNAQVATPSVSFAYDGSYGRLATMTDGTGVTSYGYNTIPLNTPVPAITGAGQLASIDGPLTNDTITTSYDEWSRTIGTAIGGVGSTAQIDAIGRLKQLVNPLGTFQYTYAGATNRLTEALAPNGMKTIMAYQALVNDFRVASIRHQTSAAARISEFGYQYSTAGRIREWTQQADNATATVWSYGYDAVDQLTAARATSGTSTGALIKEYGWQYDAMGNRLSERLSTTSTNAIGKSTSNNLNQLMSTAGGGRMQVKGQVDEPSTVTVNGTAVQVNPDKTFAADVDTVTGSNTFTVQATDLKGNVRTDQFQINTTANGAARTLAYDLNGNCIQDGTTTYGWDAQNRLVWLVQGTKRSEFTYDGAGRRVRVVEKDGAATLSDQRFVWLGATIAERRNSIGDTVELRFLGVGETEGATKRYYARDHLGSVREVVDQTGSVLVRYDYDMFGSRTRVSGSDAAYVCAFGYTGHVHHSPTGMALTWFRAYNPASGRWLSRDPIAEQGGLNLYAYVGNRPVGAIDPLGLCDPVTLTIVGVGTIVLTPAEIAAIAAGVTTLGAIIGNAIPRFPAYSGPYNGYLGFSSGPSYLNLPGGPFDPARIRMQNAGDASVPLKDLKKLSPSEAKGLSEHPHTLKPGGSRQDLYKDKDGNVYVGNKDGSGMGEPTGCTLGD